MNDAQPEPGETTAARELHDSVLAWYARHRRDLPWRRIRDPYRILVSEVMLQQTQATRVAPYYEAFVTRFPDERALAAAPVGEVLRAWSGLGYNRRALRLIEAARAIADGGWPRSAAGLEALPGVGPYTAAAVAAFAFGQPVAAVDTNVRRVVERLDGRRRPPAGLARRALELLPPGRAADWNQALMELGATVCTSRRPRCGACPIPACRSRGVDLPAVVAPPRRRRPRFEETDRYARGRLLASLLAGEPRPAGIAPERLERAAASLERDGLAVRNGGVLSAP